MQSSSPELESILDATVPHLQSRSVAMATVAQCFVESSKLGLLPWSQPRSPRSQAVLVMYLLSRSSSVACPGSFEAPVAVSAFRSSFPDERSLCIPSHVLRVACVERATVLPRVYVGSVSK